MKNSGPAITVMFYFTQLVHAYCLYQYVGPSLDDNWYNTTWLAIGWFLFYKVTYTYYWVSNSEAGSPRQIKLNHNGMQTTINSVPVNEQVILRYSKDIAELR